ncbi:MAG: tetratricopeptide repeat protein [Nitrospinaceae bacterium]
MINGHRVHSLCLVLAFSILLGWPHATTAQTPQHLQGFDISPLRQGEFLLFSKKPDEALRVFRDLWEREPGNSYAVRGIVRAYQALGKLPEAVSQLNRHLEEPPRSSAAAYGLGYVYYLQKKFEESNKVLNEALRFDPKNALALNNLGAVLAELQRYEEAVQRVKEAVGLAPDELMFYRNLQMIYLRSGNPGQFEKEYRQYLAEGSLIKAKRYGRVLAQGLRQKSFKLYVEGKLDETISTIIDMLALYREIKHKPGIVASLFSLAVLYEEQGDTVRALEKYREVIKINPQHIQAREKMHSLKPGK